MQQGTKVIVQETPQARLALDALMASRAELKDQLSSVSQMRTRLVSQLALTDSRPARDELQGRLNALDARIARIESQLLVMDDAINATMAQGVATTAPPAPALAPVIGVPGSVAVPDHEFHQVVGSMEESFAAGLVAAGLAFILVATIFYRMGRKRTRQLFEALTADQARRFAELQNAIDVVAVETERISEAQRFVSKRVNELGAGEAQPIGTARPMAETVRRDQR